MISDVMHTMAEKETKKSMCWMRDLVVMAAIIAGVLAYQTWDHVERGTEAPAFNHDLLDGSGTLNSASLNGKPTVIYFWAPWCGVCDASSHNMNAVMAAAGDDANVLSIALDYKDIASVQDFATRHESQYPVLLGDDVTRDAYAVSAYPTIYVLDPDGRITSSVVGYTTEFGIRARLWWAAL